MPGALADETIAKISKRKIRSLVKSPAKTAEAVNLVYVNDSEEGIIRKRKADGFEYSYKGKRITDDETRLRIKHLAIPPAWENVWICPLENGHLQATGTDARGRKQYRYHSNWSSFRNHTKFYKLYQFGEALPALRLRVENDLTLPGLPVNKVLATVISLMERTNIRVGNCSYEKENGSYGITTLKDKHVKLDGTTIKFSFKGKKGIYHEIGFKNRKLAKIVKQCRDIPGKELFQYIDEEGKRKSIDSGMVNAYIKEATGDDFTAKDLRTWSGTFLTFLAFKELGVTDTQTQAKRNIQTALDMVSKALGNTKTVCKKYYVHPLLVSLYETQSLEKHLKELDEIEKADDKSGLTKEEIILMNILKTN